MISVSCKASFRFSGVSGSTFESAASIACKAGPREWPALAPKALRPPAEASLPFSTSVASIASCIAPLHSWAQLCACSIDNLLGAEQAEPHEMRTEQ